MKRLSFTREQYLRTSSKPKSKSAELFQEIDALREEILSYIIDIDSFSEEVRELQIKLAALRAPIDVITAGNEGLKKLQISTVGYSLMTSDSVYVVYPNELIYPNGTVYQPPQYQTPMYNSASDLPNIKEESCKNCTCKNCTCKKRKS